MSTHADPAEIKKQVRSYIAVFVALMVLTVVTVAVSYLHVALPLAVTVALIVATIKGGLVASVFMHLSHEKKIIYASLILTVIFFVFLISIPIASHMDWISRRSHEQPAAHPPAQQQRGH
jgi:cytochrome c oxidase subunit 4